MGRSIGTVIGTLVFDFKGMYRIVTLWAYELCCCGFYSGLLLALVSILGKEFYQAMFVDWS